MKKILPFLILGSILVLSSCDSFLERNPIAQIGADDYFTTEGALINYTNGFLNSYVPGYSTLGYGDEYSDIVETNSSTSFLYNTSWTPTDQSGWTSSTWKPIYNINYFLVHMREVPDLSDETYNHYEGTGRFWRAWQYWDLVKTFGAVPWYEEPIDADDEEALYKPRDSREYVMDKVLEDLNFASENIFATSDWVNCQRVSKYVALAYKARVCLFEGTYRKYHSVDPSTGQPWEDNTASDRFLRECVNACEELMNAGVYKIVDDGTEEGRATQYRKLFTQEAIDYTEIIWARQYSVAYDLFHELTKLFNSGSAGHCWGLNQTFIQTYLHRDGSRHYENIATRAAAGEMDRRGEAAVTLTTEFFEDECEGRDLRLSQQIITPGFTKTVAGVANTPWSPVFTSTRTGYQIVKWNIDDDAYEDLTNCYNSLSILRYAEVLLNYAEAKCELGEFSDDVWDKTIKVLRERAGVDGTRRTDIDQSLADYYGGLTNCDLVEIRRERAIEMLLENLRYDDLMRWHCGELLNETWYGMYVPYEDTLYDVDGNGTIDLWVSETGSNSEAKSSIVLDGGVSNSYFLEDGDHGRLIWNVVRHFDESHYLRPIPKTALDINPALGQNYGY